MSLVADVAHRADWDDLNAALRDFASDVEWFAGEVRGMRAGSGVDDSIPDRDRGIEYDADRERLMGITSDRDLDPDVTSVHQELEREAAG